MAMTPFEIILAVGLLAVISMLVYVYFLRPPIQPQAQQQQSENLLLLQQQLQDLSRTVDQKMTDTNKAMQETTAAQFRESKALIQDINKEVNEQLRNVVKGVTEVGESSKQVFTVAEQLQNLEKVLKHQKQRGNLGEASLQLALENMLPPGSYQMEYYFQDGEAVDAIIETKDGIIPIDAKFSLDNYRRLVDAADEAEKETLEREFKNDLKKRIDETAKYIRPQENTLPFAFMYIPAEAIYYDLLVNEVGSVKVNTRSLIDYAYTDKNVIIVSPTTFAAYLQSVLYGFRAFRIEESAKQISKQVELLGRHLRAYETYFTKVGNSLGTTVNHYNTAQRELAKVDKDVMKITGEAIGIEGGVVEKPEKIDV